MKTRRAILAVAAALLATVCATVQAAPATAAQTAPHPWSSWSYDFGTATTTHTFTFTNVWPIWIVDYPLPFHHGNVFHMSQDTCQTAIAPGLTCQVVVDFSGGRMAGPIVDQLQLSFDDLNGNPVATPGVTLFAQNPQYASTDYPNGDVVFPATRAGTATTIDIYYHLHGFPTPIDYPVHPRDPWTVGSNTCTTVQSGQLSCFVVVQFQPTKPGSYQSPFALTFEDPQTGTVVPSQTLTLYGNGV